MQTSSARNPIGLDIEEPVSPEKKLLRCRHCGKEYLFDVRHLNGRTKAKFQCRRCNTVFEQSFQAEEEETGNRKKRALPRFTPHCIAVLLAAAILAFTGYTVIQARTTSNVLTVSDPGVSQVTTSNGILYTFHGSVKNSSSSSLREINVEIRIFSLESQIIATHAARLAANLAVTGDSNVQAPASALRRAAAQMTLAPGEEIRFSVPVLLDSAATPDSFTIRAFIP